ncbi:MULTISPECIES: hypothetical protein [Microbacterium]|uniref:hypothetical protein n=1 Tax=Microbacterium TaxID=33882 RepID=UPI001EF69357|nr:hypothetical protein [Microbacterium sp. KCTC 39802]
MTLLSPLTASAADRLDAVAREIGRLIERMTDAALVARGLADVVDWQAKAATAFHERATGWAGDVSGLASLAETVRYDVIRARERAAFAESLSGITAGSGR